MTLAIVARALRPDKHPAWHPDVAVTAPDTSRYPGPSGGISTARHVPTAGHKPGTTSVLCYLL